MRLRVKFYNGWRFYDENDEQEKSWSYCGNVQKVFWSYCGNEKEPYWMIAKKMSKVIDIICSREYSDKEKITPAASLRRMLYNCLRDENLDALTSVYRYKKADNVLGFEGEAISKFVSAMLSKYPEPKS